jgi:hypothetical protein
VKGGELHMFAQCLAWLGGMAKISTQSGSGSITQVTITGKALNIFGDEK